MATGSTSRDDEVSVMDAQQTDELWREIDALAVLRFSQHLDVCGFVLGDHFDTLLRQISADYLGAAWSRLRVILQRYRIEPQDFRWGWLHDGETRLVGTAQMGPSAWTGWTSQHWNHLDDAPYFADLDEELKAGSPALRCGCTWRSRQWRIAPDDFALAMRLIEALWADDPLCWSPHVVLHEWERIEDLLHKAIKANQDGDFEARDRYLAEERTAYTSPAYRLQDEERLSEPWRKVAAAIEAGSQRQLTRALEEAHTAYSPVGYRILVRGYKRSLPPLSGDMALHLP
jgi:hypothetical protein